MAIEAIKFFTSKFNTVPPVSKVASNSFNYEKALENAGLKFNSNPGLLQNPQARLNYLS